MSWWETVPLILLAGAVLVLPGLAFSWGVRVRGLARLLLAPLFSVALASVLSLALPIVGVAWTPLSYLFGVVALVVIAMGIRSLIVRRWPDPEAQPERQPVLLASVLGLLVAATIITWQMATAFQSPGNISQTFDNVFHLNAVRWAMDSGNASPLNLGSFTGISAYPSAWHAMTSLVAMLSGASIPVTVNITNIAIGAIVWPFGCLYLVQRIMGQRVVSTVVALIFIPAFTGFPLLMVDWGVLYPNLLSIALLPAALGLALNALGLTRGHRPSTPIAWLLVLVSIPAVAVSHPSTLMALVVFVVPAVAFLAYGRLQQMLPMDTPERRRGVRNLVVVSVVSALVLGIVWRTFRPPKGSSSWGAVESPSQAVGELLLGGALGRPAAVVIAICMIVGLVRIVLTRTNLWVLGTFVVAGVLFFYAAGLNWSPRWFLTGVWYYDSNRLAALLPVAMLGPAVIGATYLWDNAHSRRWTSKGAQREQRGSWDGRKRSRRVVVYTAGTLALLFATQYGVMTWAVERAHWTYRVTPTSGLLTPDETALLNRLNEHAAPGDVIAGLPSSGAALAYAYSSLNVLEPHILTTHGDDVDVVNAGLKSAADFPWTCDAVRSLNVKYALDFGTRTVTGTMAGYGGLMDLESSTSLELIDEQGLEAKLYKVTACW